MNYNVLRFDDSVPFPNNLQIHKIQNNIIDLIIPDFSNSSFSYGWFTTKLAPKSYTPYL